MFRVASKTLRSLVGYILTVSVLVQNSLCLLAQETLVPVSPGETVIEVIDHEKAAKIKAVFIFQICQFVKWPERVKSDAENGAFVIGVVGNSLVHTTLIDISKRREIHGKTVVVKQFGSPDEVELGSCSVLFIPPSIPTVDVTRYIDRLADWPVLLFTDTSNPPRKTIVNFLIENQNVVFELNNSEAQRRKLAMDAKLLRQGRVMKSSSQ